MLQKVDQTALGKICIDPNFFIGELRNESETLGIKWDDLILNYEWQYEERAILDSKSLTDEQKAIIADVAKLNRFAFNKELIEQWAASQQQSAAD